MKFTRENAMNMLKLILDHPDVKVLPEAPSDATFVVTRVEDFHPESNEVWHLQANRSYPREGVVCDSCQFAVVMSDGAFKTYSKNPDPSRIICGKCFLKQLV